jgi:hypothetical protein
MSMALEIRTTVRCSAVVLLLMASGCDGKMAMSEEAGSSQGSLYDRPLVSSVDGAEVRFEALPETWTLAKPGLSVRVIYRNAPAGAGLQVHVTRDVSRRELADLPSSGGGLTAQPIPVEGDGVIEVKLTDEAFSAPADTPRPVPLQAGSHVLLAQLYNHRRGTIGYVRRRPEDRTLAEALSPPIMLREGE